jgi:hypothetical protein
MNPRFAVPGTTGMPGSGAAVGYATGEPGIGVPTPGVGAAGAAGTIVYVGCGGTVVG